MTHNIDVRRLQPSPAYQTAWQTTLSRPRCTEQTKEAGERSSASVTAICLSPWNGNATERCTIAPTHSTSPLGHAAGILSNWMPLLGCLLARAEREGLAAPKPFLVWPASVDLQDCCSLQPARQWRDRPWAQAGASLADKSCLPARTRSETRSMLKRATAEHQVLGLAA
jgi:hypothetical protein